MTVRRRVRATGAGDQERNRAAHEVGDGGRHGDAEVGAELFRGAGDEDR